MIIRNKQMWKRILCLCISALLLMTLTACGKAEPVSENIRVGALKGPTTLGILNLMEKSKQGETFDTYEFQMAVGADELLPLMIKGELDIALVPANVASSLYAKTEGNIQVIDINTLSVLYLVTGTAEVTSVADLKGKTLYLTGKGTTPEASIRYLLAENGLNEGDCTLEFKSEATEVAALLAQDPDAVGLLPQPFVTAAMMQNEALKVVVDLEEAWQQATGSGMVTGVTIVRKDFAKDHKEAVDRFLEEHSLSVDAILADPAKGATLAVEAGIVAKEPIAQKAIPKCHLACVRGQEMKESLEQYLKVLEGFKKELIGGQLPGDDFYYLGGK